MFAQSGEEVGDFEEEISGLYGRLIRGKLVLRRSIFVLDALVDWVKELKSGDGFEGIVCKSFLEFILGKESS